jgi:hypothetical protein
MIWQPWGEDPGVITAYGADPASIAAMRDRFTQWREQLLTQRP